MRFQTLIYVVLLPVVSAVAGAAAPSHSEDFSDPSFEWQIAGFKNIVGKKQTNLAGGEKAGEAGGAFYRTPTLEFFADTSRIAEPLTQENHIAASGKSWIGKFNDGMSVFLGHFKVGSPDLEKNTVGFMLEPKSNRHLKIVLVLTDSQGEGFVDLEINIRDDVFDKGGGMNFDWSYSLDPENKRLTYSFENYSGQVELPGIHDVSVNAFGLATKPSTNTESAGVDVFIDDVKYTVSPTAEE